MEDLNAAISSILGDPQKMEQLRGIAQSLGMNPPSAGGGETSGGGQPAAVPQAPQGGGFDPAAFASILQGLQGMAGGGAGATSGAVNAASAAGAQTGGLNIGMITKIGEIMQTFNQNDKNVDLLRTLRPHISTGRAGKIDDAIRIMQLLRAWPAIRDSGLLSNLGGLGSLLGGGGNR